MLASIRLIKSPKARPRPGAKLGYCGSRPLLTMTSLWRQPMASCIFMKLYPLPTFLSAICVAGRHGELCLESCPPSPLAQVAWSRVVLAQTKHAIDNGVSEWSAGCGQRTLASLLAIIIIIIIIRLRTRWAGLGPLTPRMNLALHRRHPGIRLSASMQHAGAAMFLRGESEATSASHPSPLRTTRFVSLCSWDSSHTKRLPMSLYHSCVEQTYIKRLMSDRGGGGLDKNS